MTGSLEKALRYRLPLCAKCWQREDFGHDELCTGEVSQERMKEVITDIAVEILELRERLQEIEQ